MEPRSGKESVVSRLFGFGRRKPAPDPDETSEAGERSPEGEAARESVDGESGFARIDRDGEDVEARDGDVRDGDVRDGEAGDGDDRDPGARPDGEPPQVTIPEQVIRIRTTPVGGR